MPTIRVWVRGRQSLRDAGERKQNGDRKLGPGLSEDGRETFDSVEQARSMLEHDTDLSPEELDSLFETGNAADESGFWIVVE